jgi:hypothetical protein
MNPPLTIPGAPHASPALDYHELRKEGIAYLEEVVGSLWSDYNVHDPGITLLELLCFGITDVAFRTSLEDADLFAPSPDDESPSPFVTARDALTCHPITSNDYRRLILDTFYEDVRNVWVQPTSQVLYADPKARQLTLKQLAAHVPFEVKGLYDIRLQLTPGERTASEEKALLQDVRKLYHQHRLLGEDLNAVTITKTQPVMVCADIQLAPDADIEEAYALIVHRLRNFLSPRIPRYKLADLVAKGFKAEEIFSGPKLTNGFILEEDLELSTSVTTVRSSDLIAAILQVEGVVALPKILLNHAGENEDDSELWELEIPDELEPELTLENARLRFYKDLIPFHPNLAKTRDHLDQLIATEAAANDFPDAEDFPIPEGNSTDLSSFTTLQESLPTVYGCGSRGTNRDPSPQGLGKAKQLKAFLLVFDQMLSNYLGQLVNLTSLFSSDPGISQTLFANAVSDLPDLHHLLRDTALLTDSESASANALYQTFLDSDSASDDFQKAQRSRILDHLLARFGESFADHVLMHYTSAGKRTSAELNAFKGTFLTEASGIATRRATAHDYTDSNEVWNTTNVSGFKHRLERLLGFPTYRRRSLSDITFEYYEAPDDAPDAEIRFRIVDPDAVPNKIILSGTTEYQSKEDAVAAMREAIQLGMSVANFDIKKTGEKIWSIEVVNRQVDPPEIVATRKQNFENRREAEKARNKLSEFLADRFSEEGSFVLEHILFRPLDKDSPFLPAPCEATPESPQSWDPYSHQVHIIMPGWGERLSDPAFRAFVAQTIRRELPAHLVPRVCFISRKHMREFEKCYRAWLTALANEDDKLPLILTKLFTCLEMIHTIYPPGTLHDCIEDGDELNPVVLGHTQLGSRPNPQT